MISICMSLPLVSVVVPTKNSGAFLLSCLQSIKDQTYPAIELIVVDNFSTDETAQIAHRFTDQVFAKGPERSAQRNWGVQRALGQYVCIIDSDMELASAVIEQCVAKAQIDPGIVSIVIPEESFGEGFWAQCKRLERSFYIGVPWLEAARFFKKDTYLLEGGYREEMVSGEDWDLSQRIRVHGKVSRTSAVIRHNEGALKLTDLLKKKYYYAKHFAKYRDKNKGSPFVKSQVSPIARYRLFFANPRLLLKNPVLALGMLYMKTGEFACGAIALLI